MGTESWPGRIVTEIRHGDVGVVALVGEHDLASVESLEAVLSAVLQQGHPVVVDLSEAEFVDAPVLGALRRAHRLAAERGVGFAVARAASTPFAVRRILEIAAAHDLFPLASSRAEAINLAGQAGSS
jgi:anti-anti-sigma factor